MSKRKGASRADAPPPAGEPGDSAKRQFLSRMGPISAECRNQELALFAQEMGAPRVVEVRDEEVAKPPEGGGAPAAPEAREGEAKPPEEGAPARAPAGEDAGEDEWGLGSVASVGDLMLKSEGVPVAEENGKQLEAFLEMARKKFGAERKEAEGDKPEAAEGDTSKQAEAVLKEGAETGFDLRGKLGQKFSRLLAVDPDMSTRYKELPSRQEKAKFRQSWATAQYDIVKASKVKAETSSIEHVVKGQFYTFGGLVQKYGGWQWRLAVDGAKNTALRCTLLGGQWVKVDLWSKLTMYYVTDESQTERFVQSWALYEKHFHVARREKEEDDDTARAPVRKRAIQDKEEDDDIATMPAPVRAIQDKKESPKGKAKARPGPSEANRLVEATRLKVHYAKIKASATTLMEMIRGGKPEYSWADHEKACGPLAEALAALEEAVTGSTFITEFLVEEPKGMKAAMTDGEFTSGLENFLKIRPLVGSVQEEAAQIMGMKRRRKGAPPAGRQDAGRTPAQEGSS